MINTDSQLKRLYNHKIYYNNIKLDILNSLVL